jgi:UPF0042 nucleotide-binding protein
MKTKEKENEQLSVTIISFGYKEGPPPNANVLFDVRFLKNPYWVDELRPLTGLDKAVQDYVLEQEAAKDFLQSIIAMMKSLLPQLTELNIYEFTIAFGCTGGQHRSTALAESLSKELKSIFPKYEFACKHRELSGTRKKTTNKDNLVSKQ